MTEPRRSQSGQNQVALVTGAARGLGLRVAEDLAASGLRVAGIDRREAELQDEMARIREQAGVETLALPFDAGVEGGVVESVARTVDRWGRIDVLINNAGERGVAPVGETETDLWNRIQDSNLKSQYLFAREVLRQDMLARGEGTLVFISSLAGTRSVPKGCAYSASKWGIRGFAESVAKDLKETRIRVTTILPGMILTPMARESEVWDLDLDWLDPGHVSRLILFCIQQDSDTIIPEICIHHRAQI